MFTVSLFDPDTDHDPDADKAAMVLFTVSSKVMTLWDLAIRLKPE
jgi:hypothetical protein